MAAAVLPPRATSRDLPLSLSLFYACIHTLSPRHTHTLSLSHSLTCDTRHSPVAERARACKVSRMRATRTRARPPLSQKHPLRFTLYEGTPSSSTSAVTTSSSSSCSACSAHCSCRRRAIVSSPIVSQMNPERENSGPGVDDGLLFSLPPSRISFLFFFYRDGDGIILRSSKTASSVLFGDVGR